MLTERIAELNLRAPLSVAPGTSIRQVVETVQHHRRGCVLVCDDGRLLGIMTERDVLMKVVARDVDYDAPVETFMTPNPLTLTPDHTIGDAISLMTAQDIRHIPVVDAHGHVQAVLDVRDIIEHLAESFPEHVINLPPRPHQKMTTPEGA